MEGIYRREPEGHSWRRRTAARAASVGSNLPRLALAGAVLSALLAVCACHKEDRRPSVLVIIIDTLRHNYLGCYGSAFARTPNADSLAAGGALFSECVTAAPVTLPSVSSILTSSYPVYHGVRDNGVFKLDPSLVTLAEVFHEGGYSTGAVVGSYVLAEHSGIDQGFDHFDADFSGTYAEESSLLPERASEISPTQRRAAEVTERAAAWLRGSRRPFFLLAHYFDPHGPYDPPPSYIKRHPTNKYLGEVEYTDASVGPLLDAARAAVGDAGLIVVLVADHGEGLGAHGEDTHGFFIYDSTVLVPFIVSFPGRIPPGTVVRKQMATVDLAPTVLDLAGIAVPEGWQGVSRAPLLRMAPEGGDTSAHAVREVEPGPCYTETYRTRYSYNWSELVGVRDEGWKLIRAPQPELYCIAGDPDERTNLYGQRPGRTARMEALLDSLIAAASGPLAEMGPAEDLDQEAIDKLEALGYVMPSGHPNEGPLPDPKIEIGELDRRFESRDLVRKARRMMNGGDMDGAEKQLRDALKLDPKNAVAVHDLGIICYKRGELKEAASLIEQAVRMEPSSPIPRQHLGMVYLDLERDEDAATVLEAAAALDPGDADIRLGYGLALQRTGNLTGALQQYREALKLNPDLLLGYYRLALLLAGMGQYEEAKLAVEEMLSRRPPPDAAEKGKALLADIQAKLSARGGR
jgi:arylsulfatase A-like enzyme/Flp pilus assembly protein TadD